MQFNVDLAALAATVRKAPGVILYEGPSKLDGSPIVVIATGLKPKGKGANRKTGDMIQTYIIRSDMGPLDAIAQGADKAICGGCQHMAQEAGYRPNGKVFYKGRSCYVNVGQGATTVWKAYVRGVYPKVNAFQAAELLAGKIVRLGTYGDPAAAPLAIWKLATSKAEAWTGYTHQWRTLPADWAALVMASADTLQDMDDAHAAGWRTFRVTAEPFQNVKGREAVCPASDEKGKVAQCITCKACMGTSSKARVSIQIAAHGAGKSNFR
jgi:hypothetical protein